MIFPISSELWLMSSIASTIFCIFWLLKCISFPTLPTCSVAFAAVSAFCRIWSEISSIANESSWMELVCSNAPCESSCEPDDTFSAPEATLSALSLIWRTVSFKRSAIFLNERRSGWKSPMYSSSHSVSTVKSPDAILPKKIFSSWMITFSFLTNSRKWFDNTPSSSLDS